MKTLLLSCLVFAGCTGTSTPQDVSRSGLGSVGPLTPLGPEATPLPVKDALEDPNVARIAEGKATFRYDTFGDEAFWGDTLHLHGALAGAANGGYGPGVSPALALKVGLKVDVEALPPETQKGLSTGRLKLDDPALTVALLKLNAIVGVKGIFSDSGELKSVGLTCAACHSTVDDAFAPGIGHRLDGWPNRDLDVGTVVALSDDLSAFARILGTDERTVRTVLKSWGPGKYDAALVLDGKAFRPDGKSGATLIPPAFGLAGSNLHTYTGWGSVPYWNAFVAITQMHGQGNFTDTRLNDDQKFPVAARNGLGRIRVAKDLVTPKLAGLQAYQLSLPAPTPPVGSYDVAAARRGEALFNGVAKCAGCHTAPLFTESGWAMHTPSEIGIDDFQAQRSPDGRYRTTPLRGLWAHAKGGYYHDGRFATLTDVVQHYGPVLGFCLSTNEEADLVAYLSSL